MKGITWLLVAVGVVAGIVAFTAPASLHADDSAAPLLRNKNSPRIPGLEVDLRLPRSRQPEQYWRRFG